MFWNPLNGVGEDVVAAPPPSQLISRRPLARGPAEFMLFTPPIAARNALTVGVIDAMSAPAALNVIALANAGLALSTSPNATATRRIAFLGTTELSSRTQTSRPATGEPSNRAGARANRPENTGLSFR